LRATGTTSGYGVIALNLILGVLMLLAFVTNNRLTV
jgi:hypothetical protein